MTENEVLKLSELHEKVRERIRSTPRTQRHTIMREQAQTRFREAYSEADLEIEPDPQMPED